MRAREYLDKRQWDQLDPSIRFAAEIGRPINTFITIQYGATALEPVQVGPATRKLIKNYITPWLRPTAAYPVDHRPAVWFYFLEDVATAVYPHGAHAHNPSLRAGLAVSDKVLVPVSPRSFETWALEGMDTLIEEASITNAGLEALAVVNLAFPRGSDNEQTQAILKEDYPRLKLVEPHIVQRKIFSDGVGQGLSVLEAKPRNPDAINELLGLLTGLGFNQTISR